MEHISFSVSKSNKKSYIYKIEFILLYFIDIYMLF